MLALSLFAYGLVVFWLLLAGGALHTGREGDPLRPAVRLTAGLVGLHLLVQLLAASGAGWSRPALLVALGATGLLFVAGGGGATWRQDLTGSVPWLRWDWLQLVPASALAVVAFAARSPIPDFFFHWGMKARRYFEVRDFDLEFLGRPENGYSHPDYPSLPSELFAVTAILGDSFVVPVLLLWTVVFYLLLAWSVRAALAQELEPKPAAVVSLAVVLPVAVFSIGYYQSGGADLPLAAAVLLGVLLLRRNRAGDALAVGWTSALAAALKIEGIAFGFFLVLFFGFRHRRTLLSRPLLALSLGLVPAVVVGLWLYQVVSWDLFQPDNTAAPLATFGAERIGAILSGAWWSVLRRPWYGLPFLFVLMPLLLLRRRSRSAGALLATQLGFYLYLYLATPHEPRMLVMSSFPRLLLHLMPAFLVVLFLDPPFARLEAKTSGATGLEVE